MSVKAIPKSCGNLSIAVHRTEHKYAAYAVSNNQKLE
jgi:hypothetical protein